MAINLQVEITVKKSDTDGKPSGDPLYSSTTPIEADTDGLMKVTIPGMAENWEVHPEAGKKRWLKFFAISPLTDGEPLQNGLSFVVSDGKCSTGEFTLMEPVAYWGDTLNQLYKGAQSPSLTELEKLVFTNKESCAVDVTIYFVRNVAEKIPDPCPVKRGAQAQVQQR
jgi:hypothetical protein